MPQMFPLLWLPLFFASSLMILLSASVVHFFVKPSLKSNSQTEIKLIKSANWKW